MADTRFHTGPYDHEFDAPPALDARLFEDATPLASPWRRLAAVLLDAALFIGAVSFPLAVGITGEETGSRALEAIGAMALVVAVLGLAIYQVVLLSRDGQTLGKRILNLRIVDEVDEHNPGFVRAVLVRGLLMHILAMIPLVWLIDVLMIFSDDHKTLHDRMARTVVVDERALM